MNWNISSIRPKNPRISSSDPRLPLELCTYYPSSSRGIEFTHLIFRNLYPCKSSCTTVDSLFFVEDGVGLKIGFFMGNEWGMGVDTLKIME